MTTWTKVTSDCLICGLPTETGSRAVWGLPGPDRLRYVHLNRPRCRRAWERRQLPLEARA